MVVDGDLHVVVTGARENPVDKRNHFHIEPLDRSMAFIYLFIYLLFDEVV